MTQTNASGTVLPTMLMIRLQRVGRKNFAEYRIVVTEKERGPKSGNIVELIGHYNPHTDTVTLKADRVRHWMSVGAQVSGTVFNILVDEKIIDAKKKNVLPKKTPITKEEEKKEVDEQKAEETKKEDATAEVSEAEEVAGTEEK